MERLRRWYLNFRGQGDELGPDKLMGLFYLVIIALAALGDTGYWFE